MAFPRLSIAFAALSSLRPFPADTRVLSDFKVCADEECSMWVYKAKARQDFIAPDCRYLSFKKGTVLYVFHLLSGIREDLWAGTEGNDFGYFPKDHLEVIEENSKERYKFPAQITDFMCVPKSNEDSKEEFEDLSENYLLENDEVNEHPIVEGKNVLESLPSLDQATSTQLTVQVESVETEDLSLKTLGVVAQDTQNSAELERSERTSPKNEASSELIKSPVKLKIIDYTASPLETSQISDSRPTTTGEAGLLSPGKLSTYLVDDFDGIVSDYEDTKEVTDVHDVTYNIETTMQGLTGTQDDADVHQSTRSIQQNDAEGIDTDGIDKTSGATLSQENTDEKHVIADKSATRVAKATIRTPDNQNIDASDIMLKVPESDALYDKQENIHSTGEILDGSHSSFATHTITSEKDEKVIDTPGTIDSNQLGLLERNALLEEERKGKNGKLKTLPEHHKLPDAAEGGITTQEWSKQEVSEGGRMQTVQINPKIDMDEMVRSEGQSGSVEMKIRVEDEQIDKSSEQSKVLPIETPEAPEDLVTDSNNYHSDDKEQVRSDIAKHLHSKKSFEAETKGSGNTADGQIVTLNDKMDKTIINKRDLEDDTNKPEDIVHINKSVSIQSRVDHVAYENRLENTVKVDEKERGNNIEHTKQIAISHDSMIPSKVPHETAKDNLMEESGQKTMERSESLESASPDKDFPPKLESKDEIYSEKVMTDEVKPSRFSEDVPTGTEEKEIFTGSAQQPGIAEDLLNVTVRDVHEEQSVNLKPLISADSNAVGSHLMEIDDLLQEDEDDGDDGSSLRNEDEEHTKKIAISHNSRIPSKVSEKTYKDNLVEETYQKTMERSESLESASPVKDFPSTLESNDEIYSAKVTTDEAKPRKLSEDVLTRTEENDIVTGSAQEHGIADDLLNVTIRDVYEEESVNLKPFISADSNAVGSHLMGIDDLLQEDEDGGDDGSSLRKEDEEHRKKTAISHDSVIPSKVSEKTSKDNLVEETYQKTMERSETLESASPDKDFPSKLERKDQRDSEKVTTDEAKPRKLSEDVPTGTKEKEIFTGSSQQPGIAEDLQNVRDVYEEESMNLKPLISADSNAVDSHLMEIDDLLQGVEDVSEDGSSLQMKDKEHRKKIAISHDSMIPSKVSEKTPKDNLVEETYQKTMERSDNVESASPDKDFPPKLESRDEIYSEKVTTDEAKHRKLSEDVPTGTKEKEIFTASVQQPEIAEDLLKVTVSDVYEEESVNLKPLISTNTNAVGLHLTEIDDLLQEVDDDGEDGSSLQKEDEEHTKKIAISHDPMIPRKYPHKTAKDDLLEETGEKTMARIESLESASPDKYFPPRLESKDEIYSEKVTTDEAKPRKLSEDVPTGTKEKEIFTGSVQQPGIAEDLLNVTVRDVYEEESVNLKPLIYADSNAVGSHLMEIDDLLQEDEDEDEDDGEDGSSLWMMDEELTKKIAISYDSIIPSIVSVKTLKDTLSMGYEEFDIFTDDEEDEDDDEAEVDSISNNTTAGILNVSLEKYENNDEMPRQLKVTENLLVGHSKELEQTDSDFVEETDLKEKKIQVGEEVQENTLIGEEYAKEEFKIDKSLEVNDNEVPEKDKYIDEHGVASESFGKKLEFYNEEVHLGEKSEQHVQGKDGSAEAMQEQLESRRVGQQQSIRGDVEEVYQVNEQNDINLKEEENLQISDVGENEEILVNEQINEEVNVAEEGNVEFGEGKEVFRNMMENVEINLQKDVEEKMKSLREESFNDFEVLEEDKQFGKRFAEDTVKKEREDEMVPKKLDAIGNADLFKMNNYWNAEETTVGKVEPSEGREHVELANNLPEENNDFAQSKESLITTEELDGNDENDDDEEFFTMEENTFELLEDENAIEAEVAEEFASHHTHEDTPQKQNDHSSGENNISVSSEEETSLENILQNVSQRAALDYTDSNDRGIAPEMKSIDADNDEGPRVNLSEPNPINPEATESEPHFMISLLGVYLTESKVSRLQEQLGKTNVLLLDQKLHEMDREFAKAKDSAVSSGHNVEEVLDAVLSKRVTQLLAWLQDLLDLLANERQHESEDTSDEEMDMIGDINEVVLMLREKYSLRMESTPLAPGASLKSSTGYNVLPTTNLPIPQAIIWLDSFLTTSMKPLVSVLPAAWGSDCVLNNNQIMRWAAIVPASMICVVFLWRSIMLMKSKMYRGKEKKNSEYIKSIVKKKSELTEELDNRKKQLIESEETLGKVLQKWQQSSNGRAKLKAAQQNLKMQAAQQQQEVEELRSATLSNQEQHKQQEVLKEQVEKCTGCLKQETDSLMAHVTGAEEVAQNVEQENTNFAKDCKRMKKAKANFQRRKAEVQEELDQCQRRCTELQSQLRFVQKQQAELQEAVNIKDSEVEGMSNCLDQLKQLRTHFESNEELGQKKQRRKFQEMMDVTKLNVVLKIIEQEAEDAKTNYSKEVSAIRRLEAVLENYESKRAVLMCDHDKLTNGVRICQQKLNIMSEMYQEKEMALQKKVTQEEYVRQEKELKLSETDKKVLNALVEVNNYKSKVDSLKEEFVKTERSYKDQVAENEKMVHENWLKAREAEREAVTAKRELRRLRERVLEMEAKLSHCYQTPTPKGSASAPYGSPRAEPVCANTSFTPSPTSGPPSPPTLTDEPRKAISLECLSGPDEPGGPSQLHPPGHHFASASSPPGRMLDPRVMTSRYAPEERLQAADLLRPIQGNARKDYVSQSAVPLHVTYQTSRLPQSPYRPRASPSWNNQSGPQAPRPLLPPVALPGEIEARARKMLEPRPRM
uniref:transport and Golgi organization protein 1 homolog isoform X2 n=1 Tax=Myxine glutinosa TaxID=7769 RepID=UPI00358FF2EC